MTLTTLTYKKKNAFCQRVGEEFKVGKGKLADVYIHIVSALAQPLHSLWSYVSILPQQHIGHLLTQEALLSVSCLFCFFILFMGFSEQEYGSGLPFLSPVDHVLSEFSTMTCPSWVALHNIAHSFIELHKAVIHVIILVSFLQVWFLFWMLWDYTSCFCLPSDG